MKRRAHRKHAFSLIELLVVLAIISILASLVSIVVSRGKASANGAVCKNNLRQIGQALAMYANEIGRYPFAGGWTNIESRQGPDWNPQKFLHLTWYGDLILQQALIPAPRDPSELLTEDTMFHRTFTCPGSPRVARLIDPQWATPLFAAKSGLQHCPYGYNYKGSGTWWDRLSLGLDNCKETVVLAPSRMISIGDRSGAKPFVHLQRGINPTALVPDDLVGGWHSARGNFLFCDGHVEAIRTNAITAPSSQALWNRDNQPHFEQATSAAP